MASLEFINYAPQQPAMGNSKIDWHHDASLRKIAALPMIFWADGTPWNEANHWAHERATGGCVELKTVQNEMSHLHKYANWLELPDSPDWRHFPMNRADRVLVRWRKRLIDCRDTHGVIAPSTASARMNACIRFYKHCSENGFIGPNAPKWKNIPIVIKYHNPVGFERAVSRLTTDVTIKCRVTKQTAVEDGLLPITGEDMGILLEFAARHSTPELLLMLKLGFFTGARVQTICGLKKKNLERAVPDRDVAGFWRIAVGPGSQPYVKTKFNVSGNLLIPQQLLDELKTYAYSVRRTKREEISPQANKDLLFITSRGNSYERSDDARRSSAINSAMMALRKSANSAGLKFVKSFHFHQTRATYGTQLMSILLPLGNLQAAIEFVRIAMFHKDVSTTMTYIKFIRKTTAKTEVANAYTQIFFNLSPRAIVENA